MNDKKPTVISLFSGAGGFDWGFHRAGYTTILACEKLPEPAKTLAKNLNLEIEKTPAAPTINGRGIMVQGDIRQVDFSQVGIQPDVVIGGPPCQDFSVAISKKDDKRPGLDGGRGKLYVEFVRALMFLQPKVFVFENVPGLISANSGTAYEVIQSDFQHLEEKRIESIKEHGASQFPKNEIEGYDLIFCGIVNAPELGVPQTRRRLIIIGLRRDIARRIGSDAVEKLRTQINSNLSGGNSLLSRYPLTTIEIFEGKTLLELNEKYNQVMRAFEDLTKSPPNPAAINWKQEIWNNLTFDIKTDYQFVNQITNFQDQEFELAMKEHSSILENLGWLNNPIDKSKVLDQTCKDIRLTKAVIDRMYNIPPGQNYEFVNGTKWQVEGKDISFIYRRAEPLKPAWTVMAYGGGGTYGYHYERNRAQLTLRERARIQTFTDDFQFYGPRVRAQIGEAVPPLLGERIAQILKPILQIAVE
ncbi:MAG: DNA cytosine methyltransferase [Anaerolineae bacterium]|nr:DNA cytosine methyltransferase [Anaerolineae bacterium]